MKHLLLLLFSTALISHTANGQQQLSAADFLELCDSVGLAFKMPKGYTRTDAKKNPDLGYCFAIRNEEQTMEIRYSIRLLQPLFVQYEAALSDSNTTMINPNQIYRSMMHANVLNVTGGRWYQVMPFPSQAVQKEFNADAGGSCFVALDSEFGEGYDYAQLMYLHKDDLADVYITFMSNDQAAHPDLMLVGFHALRFR